MAGGSGVLPARAAGIPDLLTREKNRRRRRHPLPARRVAVIFPAAIDKTRVGHYISTFVWRRKFVTLKDKLLADMKEALKSRDSLRLNTIRSVIAAVKNQEIHLLRKELDDDEILSLVSREVKKRKEAAALFQQGGRTDLMEKEKQEHAILQAYLPEQVSEDDLRKRIQEVVAETKAEGMKDLGQIMKILVPEFKGKADNGLIKNLAGEYLN